MVSCSTGTDSDVGALGAAGDRGGVPAAACGRSAASRSSTGSGAPRSRARGAPSPAPSARRRPTGPRSRSRVTSAITAFCSASTRSGALPNDDGHRAVAGLRDGVAVVDVHAVGAAELLAQDVAQPHAHQRRRGAGAVHLQLVEPGVGEERHHRLAGRLLALHHLGPLHGRRELQLHVAELAAARPGRRQRRQPPLDHRHDVGLGERAGDEEREVGGVAEALAMDAAHHRQVEPLDRRRRQAARRCSGPRS